MQNEQQESSSSLTEATSSLQSIINQILSNNTLKQVIQIPKLLQSLIALSLYKIGTHIGLQLNQQRLEVRHQSRLCLWNIQRYGDEQVQSELVNVEYGKMMSITFSTAQGIGEEQNQQIYTGLYHIYWFLGSLHQGRTYQPYIQPLPLLARRTEEQIEEEGANEEMEAQMNNNGYDVDVKYEADDAKAVTLNHFIHSN
ncbi:MAG: hypothetical protein EZS28_033647 [Streblomastix strix]|uniref:Uncharacterized protein n=1 Tax=Streblomastix strix TaxID=222440 RepID=A0A5J4UK79_9EUKA|nr:MAG: hypothetical protein EZS28_033647 [Streblomastix strix]